MWLVLLGCIPDLHTPGGADKGTSGMACGGELPENAWSAEMPPSDLEAVGWAAGEVLPDACMQDQNGDDVDLWQFYGQVWVLDISTMWCGPCQDLASTAQEMADDFSAEGFDYVTILPQNVDHELPSNEDLNTWADYFALDLPVLADLEGYAYNVVSNDAFPAVLVIDRDMTVYVNVSPISDASIRIAVEEIL